MPARRSAAMDLALREVAQGATPYRAALDHGLSPSSVYRALAKMAESLEQPYADNVVDSITTDSASAPD